MWNCEHKNIVDRAGGVCPYCHEEEIKKAHEDELERILPLLEAMCNKRLKGASDKYEKYKNGELCIHKVSIEQDIRDAVLDVANELRNDLEKLKGGGKRE